MAKDYYAEIYLHFTWHTLNDAPLVTADVEPKLWNHLKGKCLELDTQPIEIGGTADHVHLIASTAPTVLISEFVGRLKGASSHFVNHNLCGGAKFNWRKGYGCLSFAKRNLPALRRYVRDQKKHHAEGTTREALERFLPAE